MLATLSVYVMVPEAKAGVRVPALMVRLLRVASLDKKVKVPLLVAMPPGVTTETEPVAPLPTTAVIWVAELTV